MAAASDVSPQSYYIQHHLVHNNNTGTKQGFIVDFDVINYDSIFWAVLMGVLVLLFLFKAPAVPLPVFQVAFRLLSK